MTATLFPIGSQHCIQTLEIQAAWVADGPSKAESGGIIA